MGVDNPPGGPGKGPETTDKPTPPSNGGETPSTTPGADGKTPRADSLRAAGWSIPKYSDTGNGHREDRDDRQSQSNESSSADPAGEKPKGPADPSNEADPKGKEKPEAGDTEDSSQPPAESRHDKSDPTQTDEGASEPEKSGQAKPEDPRQHEGEREDGDRGSGTSQPETGKTAGRDDPGKEPPPQDSGNTSDDPTPAGQQTTLPGETTQYPPGSRLESLARARAQQHAYAEELRAKSQDAQPPNGTGPRPPGEQGDRSAPPHNENAEEEARGPETHPPDVKTSPVEADGGDTDPGDPRTADDQSPPSDERADPLTPEAVLAQGPEHEPLPSQDSQEPSNDSSQQPDPMPDRTPPAEDQSPNEENGPQPGPETGPPADPAIEPHAEQIEDGSKEPSESAEETSGEPKTEHVAEPHGDGERGPRVHDEPPAEDLQPPLPESAEQPPTEPVKGSETEQTEPSGDENQADQSHGEHDGDHDKKVEEPQGIDTDTNTLPYLGIYNPNRYSTQTIDEARRNGFDSNRPQEDDELRSQLPRWLARPPEIRQSPTQEDLDPAAANNEPGVVAKTPDRRRKSETEPESALDRFRRGSWLRGKDMKDAGTLADDSVGSLVGPRPPAPTGHAETGTGPTYSQPHPPGATPDSFMAAATVTMVAIEATRKLAQVLSRTDRRGDQNERIR